MISVECSVFSDVAEACPERSVLRGNREARRLQPESA